MLRVPADPGLGERAGPADPPNGFGVLADDAEVYPMLTNWDPFSEIQRLQEEISRRFVPNGRAPSFRPAVDIYEDEEGITLTAELPGVEAKDVEIDVHENVLTLKGERRLEKEDRRDGYHRIERAYGSFSRSFVLPDGVEADKCEAEMKDGLLRVRLPKRPHSKPRKIEVRAG